MTRPIREEEFPLIKELRHIWQRIGYNSLAGITNEKLRRACKEFGCPEAYIDRDTVTEFYVRKLILTCTHGSDFPGSSNWSHYWDTSSSEELLPVVEAAFPPGIYSVDECFWLPTFKDR